MKGWKETYTDIVLDEEYGFKEKKLVKDLEKAIDKTGDLIRKIPNDLEDDDAYQELTQGQNSLEYGLGILPDAFRNLDENYLQLVLNNGNRYEDINAINAADKQKYPFTKASFEEYILNIDISDFNNINLDEENYKSTYKMQKINELKSNSDTLSKKFEDDKTVFGKSFINNHTFKKLKNISIDHNELIDMNGVSFLNILDSPEPYEVNSVLARAENEIDIYIRQLDNKKKTFFLQQKLINLHKLTINERYSLMLACILLFLVGASLGAIIRKGGLGLPLVLSIVIFLTYHYIGVFGRNAAEDSSISPFIGSWLSTIILFPFAFYLTRIVSMDKTLNFNILNSLMNLFKLNYNNDKN